MKTLSKAIFIIAVLNLLMVFAGAGWLFSSGRINKSRLMNVTELFDQPVAQEEAMLKAEQAAIEKELAEQEIPLPAIPLNAQERNLVRVEITQIDRQRLDFMKRETENLQETLRKEYRLVEESRAALEAEQVAFAQMREHLAELEGGVQFKKSLSTLSEMKAKDAKTMLSTLIDGAKYVEVVTYLSAMDTEVRTAIMTQFVKDGDEQLAADLLESLRLRGLETTTDSEANE